MKVRIKETGEIKNLEIIDPNTGINWINDFIQVGTNDDFTCFDDAVDNPYEYDGDDFDYETSEDNYDWWLEVSQAHEAVDYRIHELIQEHGSDTVNALFDDIACDLEYEPNYKNQAIDEFLESLHEVDN